jgi:quercetin 2,3-dioxygenase
MIRQIEKVVAPPVPHMVGDGFKVSTFFPGSEIPMNRMSPFFLLDYNIKQMITPSKTPRGVGVHPHRGFETVTIAYKGKVAHHDSAGNAGIINEGDIQWMTAGSGVLHKEYHEKEFSTKGGLFHVVQLWVNLPAKDKMTPPKYQSITSADMGRFILPHDMGEVEVLAGMFHGVSGPASSFTKMEMYNLKLAKGAILELDFPENFNTGFLIVEGSVVINESIPGATNQFVLFKNEGTNVKIKAVEACLVLVLSGEPIHEPVSAWGPFVMNTEEEIAQAFQDYHSGKFGFLEE